MATMDELILLTQAGVSLTVESDTPLMPEGKITKVVVDNKGTVQMMKLNGEKGYLFEAADWFAGIEEGNE